MKLEHHGLRSRWLGSTSTATATATATLLLGFSHHPTAKIYPVVHEPRQADALSRPNGKMSAPGRNESPAPHPQRRAPGLLAQWRRDVGWPLGLLWST